MLAYPLSVLSCLLFNSFNLNCFTLICPLWVFSCTHAAFRGHVHSTLCTFPPVTLLLSPLHSDLDPTHLYPSPWYLLWHLRPFVLFCFNFPHTRKRKDIAWHSVSQYLCVLVSSTSICFSANGRILFFLLNEWHFSVYVHHTFFVHSSVDKHLSWCHNLAYKNSATINTIIQIVCANFISSGYFARCGIAE